MSIDRDLRFVLAWLGVSLWFVTEASAHWSGPSDPKLGKWYAAQYNAQGQWCCDKSDGHDFYDAYTLDDNGDVEFNFNGKHFRLPAYMVLRGPNPTGHAVWWFMETSEGISSYCFALGADG